MGFFVVVVVVVIFVVRCCVLFCFRKVSMARDITRMNIYTGQLYQPFFHVLLPEPRPGDLILYPESQAKQFRHFLVRANRYPSLQMGGAGEEGRERKVVLVEVSSK